MKRNVSRNKSPREGSYSFQLEIHDVSVCSKSVSRNKCPRAGSFRHPGVSASTCTYGIQCRSPFQYSLCVKAQPAAWVTFDVEHGRAGHGRGEQRRAEQGHHWDRGCHQGDLHCCAGQGRGIITSYRERNFTRAGAHWIWPCTTEGTKLPEGDLLIGAAPIQSH